MKVLHIGWILPAVFILTGCLSSTAYGEGRRPAGDQVPSTADEASSEVSYETEASAESSEPAAETSEPIRVPQHISYAGRDYLYLSNDAGATWRQLDIKPEISDATYITASAIHPGDPDFLVVGTSYYGLFASRDGGQSWTDLDPQSALRPIYQGLGFTTKSAGFYSHPTGNPCISAPDSAGAPSASISATVPSNPMIRRYSMRNRHTNPCQVTQNTIAQ
jgi:hypothetical protein